MTDRQDPRTLTFEEGMTALGEVVDRLESGDLPLEEALRAFESGVRLVRVLNERLTQAEQRIEVLSRDEDGTVRLDVAKEEEP